MNENSAIKEGDLVVVDLGDIYIPEWISFLKNRVFKVTSRTNSDVIELIPLDDRPLYRNVTSFNLMVSSVKKI